MSQRSYLEETPSTNSYLNEILKINDVVSGEAVYTFNQTQGRGQRDNNWESEPGKNLLFSIVIKPEFIPARNQFLISELTALAVKKVLDEYVENVSIKWPNDIYVKDKKIGGILIENNLLGSMLQYSIIGIGINVNQDAFPSTLPNPVSLIQILENEVDLELLAKKLHENLCKSLLLIDTEKNDEVRRYYLNSLYRRDGFHTYRDAKGEFKAKILNVTALGYLVLELEDGNVREFEIKEVAFSTEAS